MSQNTRSSPLAKAGSESASPRGIRSIETGYRILTAIQQGPHAVSLKDIAARAGVTASAAHNYLTSLVRTGMVQTNGRGQYCLGPSIATLGMTALRHVDHFDFVRSKGIALSESTGLGVAILTWTEQGPVILFNKADVRQQIFDLRNGPVRMLRTAGGHAFVAYLPRALTRPVAIRETATDGAEQGRVDDMLDNIADKVRQQGFAFIELEALPGYMAASAPVWDANGEIAYALTITAPGNLFDRRPDGPHLSQLVNTARELSMQLGAPSHLWAPA